MFVSLIVQYVIIDVITISTYGNLIESSWSHTVTSWLMSLLHIWIYENLIESSRQAHTMSLVDWCHYYIYEFMKTWLKAPDKLILCH